MDTRVSIVFCLYLLVGAFYMKSELIPFVNQAAPELRRHLRNPFFIVLALLIWIAFPLAELASYIRYKAWNNVYVRIDWNTDADGRWYERGPDGDPKDDPYTLHGPFKSLESADAFMMAWPDGDTDVYDMYTVPRKEVHRHAYVNDPTDVYWWQPR